MKLRVVIYYGTASPSFSHFVILIILIFMMMTLLFSYTNPPICARILWSVLGPPLGFFSSFLSS